MGPKCPLANKWPWRNETGLSPLKLYQSSKNPQSSTLIMAVPEDQARAVPKWIHLFSKNVQIKLKPFQTCIEQCTRSWDYHNPQTCIRTPRCCICSKKDHTEEIHSSSNGEEASDPCCTNYYHPFPADHPNCSTRPTIQQSHPAAIQVTIHQSQKSWCTPACTKSQPKADKLSQDLGYSPTNEQSQSC